MKYRILARRGLAPLAAAAVWLMLAAGAGASPAQFAQAAPPKPPLGAASRATVEDHVLPRRRSGSETRTPAVMAPSVGGTWSWQNPLPDGNPLSGVSCATASSCIAVGGGGLILATTNGGSTWTQQSSGVTTTINWDSCPTASTCYAAGDFGEIFKTTNGGATWSMQAPLGSGFFAGISCPDIFTCYAAGHGGMVAKTTDGGVSWTGTGTPTPYDLFAISCSSDTACAAVGAAADVETTTDGVHWATAATVTNPLISVSCTPKHCAAVGFAGTLAEYNSTYGTWAQSGSGISTDLYGISCPTDTSCIAVGVGGTGLSLIQPAGSPTETWVPDNAGTKASLFGDSCQANLTCVAVGDYRTIVTSSTGGSGWSVQMDGLHEAMNGVSCPGSLAVCYVAGPFGMVAKTADRGSTWVARSLGVGHDLDAVACMTSTWCVAVGANGLIELTHDGGSNWTIEQSGSTWTLTSVTCPTTVACVAVGLAGTIVGTSDGGMTWTLRVVLRDDLFGVSCAPGTLTCAAVGDNSTIFTTTDGYNNYRVVNNNLISRFQTVACPTTSICYVGGQSGEVLKTTDFFSTWSEQAYASTASLLSISCSSSTACAAVTFGQNSALTTTDGSTWSVTQVGGGLGSVSCPVSDCIAVGGLSVANLTSGIWTIESDDLRGISCPTASSCMAVGLSGLVYATIDGGATWVQRQPGTFAALNAVSCRSASVCYAAAGTGILSTTDQGLTWATHGPASMRAISCATTSACVAVGDNGSVAYTNDGTTWTVPSALASANLHAVSCTSATNCFAAADNGIYWTSDGGATWPGHFAPPQPVHGISCAAQLCVAAGVGGTIVGTADGGATWTSRTSGTSHGLLAVSCATATACMATGNGGALLATVDGGVTWTGQYADVDQLWSISCATATSCHAVDLSGRQIVATSTGGVNNWQAQGPAGNTNNLRGISCPNAMVCYAVGYPGTFLDTHDGGVTWVDHSVNTSDYLFAVSCPSTTTCFASGFPGVIYQTTNSGVTWTPQPNPDSGNHNIVLDGVSCVSVTSCVAVGTAGAALSTGNGTTWTQEASGTTQGLNGVSCPSSASCVAVGFGGVTVRRQGGSWSAGATSSNDLLSVSCTDLNTCYAVGAQGTVLMTTTFGSTWTSQTSGVGDALYGVNCVRSVCLAAGNFGDVVITTDGTSWTMVNASTQNWLRAVAVPDLNHAFIAGLSGTILATSNLTPECGTASVSSDVASPQGIGTIVHWTASSRGCSSPLYEFWLQDPNGNWTLQQAFSASNAWTWNSTGFAAGTYTVHAWANQAGDSTATYESYGSGSMTLTPCASAALTPSSVTQPAGSTVSLTASSSGCPKPEYEFWVQYPDGSWNLQQGWGGATFTWDTTGLAAGTYLVHAWVNTSGTGHDSVGSATVTLTGCLSASVSPSSPTQPAGSTIGFTASSTGCLNPEYEFWVQYPDGSWNLKQGWGGASFNWNTGGLAPGSYLVHAWVNRSGTTWEAIGSASVTLTGCTSASLSPSTVSQAAGTLVSLTAGSGGCPNPVYEFWVQYPDGSWNLKQGWSTTAAFNWDSTGLAPGIYTVHAWANQQGAAQTLEVYGAATVTLTGCTSASLSPSNPSQAAGSIVAFTASSTGCPNPRYEFWVQYPSGSWYLKQGFSTTATFNWDTAGLAPGAYTVHAWVNNQGTGHDAIGSATVTLTGCTSATVSASAVGGSITFTASASGCTGPVFEFWLLDPSGVWHLEQTFSTTNTWTWNSAGWPKGTYTIHVWTNQQGADTSTYETIGSASYTLT